jgi:hypothetical protein
LNWNRGVCAQGRLTGAGQSVGLFEFDGYFTNDIFNHANEAGNGRTNIVIQTVLLDGFDGTPSTGANGGEGGVFIILNEHLAGVNPDAHRNGKRLAICRTQPIWTSCRAATGPLGGKIKLF